MNNYYVEYQRWDDRESKICAISGRCTDETLCGSDLSGSGYDDNAIIKRGTSITYYKKTTITCSDCLTLLKQYADLPAHIRKQGKTKGNRS